MVCSKCQKLLKKTELATPGVKRKNDLYYGSPTASSTGAGEKAKSSATQGANGIGKVRIMYPILVNGALTPDGVSRVSY